MNERQQIAWLYRRVGFGLRPGQLDELSAVGVTKAVEGLLDPERANTLAAPDPWAAIDYSGFDPNNGKDNRRYIIETVASWVAAMVSTPRPFEEWMRWFWHGHFVSTLRVTKYPQVMVAQMRTFAEHGLGDFRSLLKAVTVDPAMLIYLDGVTSSTKSVNENYGREVLELFALGIGNYTEADVRAGAEALTGYRVDKHPSKDEPLVKFEPKRHDDRPKTYLGRSAVHDVDSVVDAIVAHPACAPFITGRLTRAILGPDVDPALVTRLADDFAKSGLQLRPLVSAIVDAGLRGDATHPLVSAPVPWLVAMLKATGAPPDKVLITFGKSLAAAGQVPMDAPNVAGWPGGRNWLSSSATVARFNLASGLASMTPNDAVFRSAAQTGDVGALADLLGHPAGFDEATKAAIAKVKGKEKSGELIMTLAMASPDVVVI